MKVTEIFKLKKHGQVIVFNPAVELENVLKTIVRTDGQIWNVRKVEKFSHSTLVSAIAIDVSPPINLNDEFEFL